MTSQEHICHLHVILPLLSLELIGLDPCWPCLVAGPLGATRRRLLMLGFIYLTDLRLEAKDCGSSCHGAEGTAVPQCSVPHYCFLMRRSERLQQASHLAVGCMAVGFAHF